MLKGKKTINLKDLRESQENRMRKNLNENIALNVNGRGFKGFRNTLSNVKRKSDTMQRCFGNDIKKSRTQTYINNYFEVSIYDLQEVFLTISTEFQYAVKCSSIWE